jgi:hypothetical protein
VQVPNLGTWRYQCKLVPLSGGVCSCTNKIVHELPHISPPPPPPPARTPRNSKVTMWGSLHHPLFTGLNSSFKYFKFQPSAHVVENVFNFLFITFNPIWISFFFNLTRIASIKMYLSFWGVEGLWHTCNRVAID